jgi:hypothetical protein
MIIFSCDICGRDFETERDLRYHVQIDITPQFPTAELTEADLDQDPVDEMAAILNEMTEAEFDTVEMPALGTVPTAAKLEYHLCPKCYKEFLNDPLGREQFRRRQFSKN